MIGALVALWPWGVEAADGSGKSLVLSLQGNSLSVQVEQVPLGEVLAAIAQQTGLTVHLVGSVAEDEVSVEFQNLPLQEGINRIVGGRNYVLVYAQAPAATGRLGLRGAREIGVTPSGAASSIPSGSGDSAVVRPGGNTRTEDLRSLQEWVRELGEAPEQAVGESAPQASEEQGDEGERDVLAVIAAALRDEDPLVRAAALELLGETHTPLLLGPLAEAALSDRSPQRRTEAQEPLAEGEGVAAVDVLRQGLGDSDPRVRSLAQELLDVLGEMEEGERQHTPEPY